VLVTGGAGFIGAHLVESLVEAGARVRVLDDLSTGRRENLAALGDRVELTVGDIRDLGCCRQACEGASYVFHHAALGSVPRSMEDPATTLSINVAGTANVFSAARDAGVVRLVYASSSAVYGDTERLPKREGEEGVALSPYALSKVMNEELADVFGRCFRLPAIGLRYFNVYGPRQDPAGPYAAVVPRFVAACLAGSPPVIHGDGQQSRDFTFVGDAVRANLLAAGAPASACGGVYNVAAGERVTVLELARQVQTLVGSSLAPRHEPPRPGDVRHSLASTVRAWEKLRFRAAVSLAKGLATTIESFQNERG